MINEDAFQRADQLIIDGHVDEAVNLLTDQNEDILEAEDLTVALARRLESRGLFHPAITLLTAAWRHGQRAKELALLAAGLSKKKGDSAAHTYWLERARDVAPKDAEIWNRLGVIYFGAKDYQIAAAHFRCALRADGEHAQASLNLAICLRYLGDFKGQKRVDEQNLRLGKGNSRAAQLSIAFANINLGLIEEAQEICNSVARTGYKSADLDLIKALIELKLGDPEQALFMLSEMVELYPNMTEIDKWFTKSFDLLCDTNDKRSQDFVAGQGFGVETIAINAAPLRQQAAIDLVVVYSNEICDIEGYVDAIKKTSTDSLGTIFIILDHSVTTQIESVEFISVLKDTSIQARLDLALRKSSSPYVAIIDQSINFTSNCLDDLLRSFDENPRVGMVVPLLMSTDKTTPDDPGIIEIPLNITPPDGIAFITELDFPSATAPLISVPFALLRRDYMIAANSLCINGMSTLLGALRDVSLRTSLAGLRVKLAFSVAVSANHQSSTRDFRDRNTLIKLHGGLNVLTAQVLTCRNRFKEEIHKRLQSLSANNVSHNAPLVSYSQNFEDIYLMRALAHIESGQYLDIGASDPSTDSVSQAFYDLGWRGIHVEPLASQATRLKAFRIGDIVLQAAVTDQSGPMTLFDVNQGQGISTVEESLAEKYREVGFSLTGTSVQTVTLEYILNTHVKGELHWLKIDVEGHEENVLRSWNESPVRPWIIVVESTVPTKREASYANWEHMLVDRGYCFAAFDGLNRYYVDKGRPELLESFAVPPNIFDNFVTAAPHWIQAYLPHHRRGQYTHKSTDELREVIVDLLRKSHVGAVSPVGDSTCVW